MKHRWVRGLFRRRVLIILMLLLQISFLIYVVFAGSRVSSLLSQLLHLLSAFGVLSVVAKKDKGAYKTTWVFLMLLFPLFGGLLYLLFNFQTSTRRFAAGIRHAEEKAAPLFWLPGDGYVAACVQMEYEFSQVRYLQDYVGFPVYDGTETRYFSPGEDMYVVLLPELEKAERYILLEFFIIQEGVMWDGILKILKRKAAQGVTVRVIYDDVGSFMKLPADYPRELQKFGIECVKFNPFRPFLTAKQNNRDHRKIISIDGKTAFTGGINLADEYINVYEKHGHWKDSAIMVHGKAAWSFTLMFLQMWELCKQENEDYAAFYPWMEQPCDVKADGFVLPYADSPMDRENVGEHVYLHILNQAQNYVYINTPYLIVDDSVLSALTLAAKRGVDVRIVTPHKWDKWLVHTTTRSYYRELIQAGVKVYEYSAGFIHAKSFVADDRIATVGTTNLDFRSLYLHFECGAWMWNTNAVAEVKEDFIKTLSVCQPITEQNSSVVMRLIQDIMRLFAPLM